ncbi:MAG: hypothetical protein HYS26_04370 [Candidatus Kaiserbacteria bacterium]|nr:MAG: hypothetical protein HYS26_04370 [Candidatus Kaiserbacteria bacterium]
MADTNGETRPSIFANILAIVGFIILIVVVIWGLINLASISRGWLSSLFGGSRGAAIEVRAPASTTSGTPFTVSWTYEESDEGTYALLYQCQPGIRLQVAPSQNGIPCGAAFNVGSSEKQVSVIPILSGQSTTNLPISIIFLPTATGTQAEGSATVAVLPASGATPEPTTPTPTPSSPETPALPVGPADLSVQILSVSIDSSGNGTATFDIGNVGLSGSGTYYFTAQLPTQSGYTYSSPAQSSLSPGSHVVNTLRFSAGTGGVFSVTVDPSNAVQESNEGNNFASQNASAQYYNYNNSYNYNYSQTAGYPYTYNQYQYSYQDYNAYNQYPYNYNYNYQYPYQTSYPYAY